MNESIDFFEFMILKTISEKKENAYLEKLPAELNSSFYEIANRTGSLRLKGMIEIKSSIGTTELSLTEKGKNFLEFCEKKVEEKKAHQHLDHLSKEILKCIANNVNELNAIQKALNVRETDLTLNFYFLYKKELIDFRCQNNTVKFMLTETGFSKAHSDRKVSQEIGKQISERKEKSELESKVDEKESEIDNDVKELLKDLDNEKSKKDKEIKKENEVNKIGGLRVYESKLEYYLHKYWIYITLLLIIILVAIIYLIVSSTKGIKEI